MIEKFDGVRCMGGIEFLDLNPTSSGMANGMRNAQCGAAHGIDQR
jgi:hypothetical protein